MLKKTCEPAKKYECHEVPKCEEPCEKPVTVCCEEKKTHGYGGHYLAGFIVLWIVIAVILFFVQPRFIYANENRCGEKRRSCEEEEESCEEGRRGRCVNWGSLLLWSFVIAIVIMILVWLFRSFSHGVAY